MLGAARGGTAAHRDPGERMMSRRKSIFDDGSGAHPDPQDEQPVSGLEFLERTGRVGRGRRRAYRALALWMVPVAIAAVFGFVVFVRQANNDVDATPIPSISIDLPSFDIFGTLQLKVGDCFQYPADTVSPDLTSVPPVACSKPHTAQLYALNSSSDGQCSSSRLNSSALPSNAQYDSVVVLDDTGVQIACVVQMTAPITGSAMAS